VKICWMGQFVIVAFPAWTVTFAMLVRCVEYLWQRHGDVRS
jgi:hypothetical protein